MLEKAHLVMKAVPELMHRCRDLVEHQECIPQWKEEWELLKKLIELLLPTAIGIENLESQKVVTQSLICVVLVNLEKHNNKMLKKYPVADNALFVKIVVDFQERLNVVWNTIPVDTVIATILDPRTKDIDGIPAEEVKEAKVQLQKEFSEICAQMKLNEVEIEEESDEFSFGSFLQGAVKKSRSVSKKALFDSEWEVLKTWKTKNGLPFQEDPLAWWMAKEMDMPILAKLAKAYMSIPASQASCERLFSVVKNDITDSRTSLLPDLVEALLFLAVGRSNDSLFPVNL